MPLTTDWNELQAAITEYAPPGSEHGRNAVVLSLPVSGSTARASTAVAASLLRGLVNDYFDTYDIPLEALWASIANTGTSADEEGGYSLAIYLNSTSPSAFTEHADAIRTAIEQALEDLPKNLARPDEDTASIIHALKHARVLEDDLVDA